MRNCFLKLFEIDTFRSHSNQPSSLPLKLIDRFKLTKIKLCKEKLSIMRVKSGTPATFKMEIFLTIVKELVKL